MKYIVLKHMLLVQMILRKDKLKLMNYLENKIKNFMNLKME